MAARHWFLVGLGWFAVVLGVVGIFLPLLPTTPFLLLALWSFARSSDRLHRWLLEHPTLGPIVGIWQEGRGIPRPVRNRVLLLLWGALLLSMVLLSAPWATALLTVIGVAVSVYLYSRTENADVVEE